MIKQTTKQKKQINMLWYNTIEANKQHSIGKSEKKA